MSLGVIGGGVGTTSSSAARALGPGLQAAHVGKESTFTVISHDAQPHIQVNNQIISISFIFKFHILKFKNL